MLETLSLQNFRLVSKRDAQLQSQLEENKVKDRESKREQKEKLKWYHNLFCLHCPLNFTLYFTQNRFTYSRILSKLSMSCKNVLLSSANERKLLFPGKHGVSSKIYCSF